MILNERQYYVTQHLRRKFQAAIKSLNNTPASENRNDELRLKAHRESLISQLGELTEEVEVYITLQPSLLLFTQHFIVMECDSVGDAIASIIHEINSLDPLLPPGCPQRIKYLGTITQDGFGEHYTWMYENFNSFDQVNEYIRSNGGPKDFNILKDSLNFNQYPDLPGITNRLPKFRRKGTNVYIGAMCLTEE